MNPSNDNLFYLQQLLSILNTSRSQEYDQPPQPRSVTSTSRTFSTAFSRLVTSGLRTYLNRYNNNYSVLFDTFMRFYMENNDNDDDEDDNDDDHNNPNNLNPNNLNPNNLNPNNKEYTGKVICLVDIEPGDSHYEQYQRYKECSICFEEFDKYSQIALTSCDHCYHLGCINKWIRFQDELSSQTTCPICRTVIL